MQVANRAVGISVKFASAQCQLVCGQLWSQNIPIPDQAASSLLNRACTNCIGPIPRRRSLYRVTGLLFETLTNQGLSVLLLNISSVYLKPSASPCNYKALINVMIHREESRSLARAHALQFGPIGDIHKVCTQHFGIC